MAGTRLQLLMDRFGVSGNELAGYLHVDYSLVSKWRQGKRRLNVQSANFKKIVEYFIGLDARNHYSTIKLLLADQYPDLPQLGSEEIYHLLARELSSSEKTQSSNEVALQALQSKHASHATFYSFRGPDGKLEAIQFMLEMGKPSAAARSPAEGKSPASCACSVSCPCSSYKE